MYKKIFFGKLEAQNLQNFVLDPQEDNLEFRRQLILQLCSWSWKFVGHSLVEYASVQTIQIIQ